MSLGGLYFPFGENSYVPALPKSHIAWVRDNLFVPDDLRHGSAW